MRLKQPCLAAGRAEQVVAKRVAEQGVAADGLRAWEVAVAALLASPKAAWNMRGIDSGTGPQLNAMPLARLVGGSAHAGDGCFYQKPCLGRTESDAPQEPRWRAVTVPVRARCAPRAERRCRGADNVRAGYRR
jgi:hypothetical protein